MSGKTVNTWEWGMGIASLTVPQRKALYHALGIILDELSNDVSKTRQNHRLSLHYGRIEGSWMLGFLRQPNL